LASGPSLTASDVDKCRGETVFCVNDTYRLAPWGSVVYACDPEWWDAHDERVKADFKGQAWTQSEKAARKYALNRISGFSLPGLSRDSSFIHFNNNGGAQAINLAVNFGARELILLGFDMMTDGARSHFFGNHTGRLQRPSDYDDWVKKFDKIAADARDMGVKIINCSRRTALKCFPRRDLDEVLSGATWST
jgi:hypothetical protein